MSTGVLEAITATRLAAGARAWQFPALAASAAPGPVFPDMAAWLRTFSAKLAVVVDHPVVADPAPVPADLDLAAYSRDDGVRLVIGLPRTLAAAIVTHRCGGGFDSTGVVLDSPSVDRTHRELAALACRAWPGHGEWTPCPTADPPVDGATLTIDGRVFGIGCTVVLPAPAAPVAPPETVAAWAHDLRAAVAAMPYDLRVVLHEAGISLAAAVRLRAGDVIPIDTASAVLLRVGELALARGTVATDPRGGHRITIVGGPSRGLCPAQAEDLP